MTRVDLRPSNTSSRRGSPSTGTTPSFPFGAGPSTSSSFQFTGNAAPSPATGSSSSNASPGASGSGLTPASRSTSSGSPRFTPPSTDWGSVFSISSDGFHQSGQSTPRRHGRSPSDASRTTGSSNPVATPGGSTSSSSDVGGSFIMPSIERDASTPASASSSRMTTPSISLSPPPIVEERGTASPTPSTPRQGRSQSSLVGGLGSLALAQGEPSDPMGMSAVANALQDVANGNDGAIRPDLRRLSAPPPPASPQSPGSRTREPPHDVQTEEPPEGRFNDPEVQQALVYSTGLMKRLARVLEGTSLRGQEGSTIGRLYRESQGLAAFQVQATRKVGFVGDSGVGKSRLLNSLLDFDDLARTSNSGGACTCVATEYHYHARDDFSIEVGLFSLEEVKTQVTRLLHVYRQHYLNPDETSQPRHESENIHEVAESTFRTLFGTERCGRDFLCGADVDAVLSDLHAWVEEGYPREMEANLEGISQGECSDELMRLTSPSSGSEDASPRTAKWPYIRQVKVFLKAHILSKGLVLVDLPGLRDVNAARVAVTERHLQRCNEIFAVSRIGRAATDAGVKSVFQHAIQANLSNVGIICTHSDEVKAHEAMRDWTGQQRRRVESLSESVALLNQQSEQCGSEDTDAMDEEEMRSHIQHERSIRRQLSQAKLALKRYLVETRNHIITRQLKQEYNTLALDGNVRVFCVSNTIYGDWRRQPKSKSADWLELSGIIALRRHCLGLTMESQMRSLKDYITADIPALLSEVDLWVQSGAETADTEQKRKMREALDQFQQDAGETYKPGSSTILDAHWMLNDEFNTKIFHQRRTQEWNRQATRAAADWERMHHSSYKRFCEMLGDHTTDKVGYRNWNQEAIQGMLYDMERHWDGVLERITSLQNSIEEDADAFSLTRSPEFRAAFGDNVAQLRSIQRSVQSRERRFLSEVNSTWGRFKGDIAELHTVAFSGSRCSLIVKLLMPAYDQCNADCGSGSHNRRKIAMRSGVANHQLFEDLMRQAQQLFDEAGAKMQAELDESVETFLAEIAATLDFVREDNAALESEQDPEFRRLLESNIAEVNEEMRDLDEVVRGHED